MIDQFLLLFIFISSGAFIKSATVFSIIRHGLGLHSFVFGIVVLILSLSLSFFVSSSQIDKTFDISNKEVNINKIEVQRFFNDNTDQNILDLFEIEDYNLESESESKSVLKQNFNQSLVAFVFSEVKAGIFLGLLFLIPLLAVDLVLYILSLILNLKNNNFKMDVFSVPLKLLVFILIGGFELLGSRIITGYL